MAITKLWIDEPECIACGACEAACPEVFAVNDVAKLKEGVDFNQHESAVRDASDGCPTECIHIE